MKTKESIYDFTVKAIDGTETSMADYKNNVLLIVNTASKCGFTPQYHGLENLYRMHKSQGFYVLGFPCNQFAGQEPGTDAEVQHFCSTTYDVTFPMFAKIEVNGANAHPLYKYLTKHSKGIFSTGFIKWNFTKFLIGRNGKIVKRYAPSVKPEELSDDIKKALHEERWVSDGY